MPPTPHDAQLLDLAASLPAPVVLLEDGRGGGTRTLAWGARERLRLAWGSPAASRLAPGPGWVGVIGYDTSPPPGARRRAPMLTQPLVDLFRPMNRITLRRAAEVECAGPDAARRAAEWGVGRGSGGAEPGFTAPPRAAPSVQAAPPAPERSLDRAGFEAAVRRTLEHINAGDAYQVNLSVAERWPLVVPPFTAYRRLRAINPSPWMGYADFGDWQLVSGSPELLVETRDGRAFARPIAGTRRKTGEPAADAAMRRELQADPKEAAEHVMLVDLARNDLGRVARYGSVRVAALRRVEEYSHVMHLVSDVEADLVPGAGAWEAFRAVFPGGTITGCPKVRAMEIIADLEPVARGMYTGALGWWEEARGQWNILIRSAVVRDGAVLIQAGAGIVADSDPAREWREALRKGAAVREAFGVATGAME